MSRIQKIPLPQSARLWLQVRPEDFIDGYAVASDLSPRDAADLGLSLPGWAQALLDLRNRLVRPLGLKTDRDESGDGALFPVTFEDDHEIILGTDDSHLNFRISVVQRAGQIHMGTWVRRNNLLGRMYLAAVMPFHILIVRDAMRRIARHSAAIASQPPAQ
jgi:hypothetical protein